MVRIVLTGFLLGLSAFTIGTPIQARQDADDTTAVSPSITDTAVISTQASGDATTDNTAFVDIVTDMIGNIFTFTPSVATSEDAAATSADSTADTALSGTTTDTIVESTAVASDATTNADTDTTIDGSTTVAATDITTNASTDTALVVATSEPTVPSMTVTTVLGSSTITYALPVESGMDRNENGGILSEGSTDVQKWCKTTDVNDPEAVVALWEDMRVGLWLENYLKMMPNGGDNWIFSLINETDPLNADPKIRGCVGLRFMGSRSTQRTYLTNFQGAPKGFCNPDIDCEEWVSRWGMGEAYWALQGAAGMQNKINAANDFMLMETMESLLNIPGMKDDFSEPESESPLETFAAIISSSLFVFGGVAGLGSVAASFVGAAATSAVGVAEAAIAQGIASNKREGIEQGEASLAAAEKRIDSSAKFGRGAAALGGATYLLGSTFSTISSAGDPDNQVPAGKLETALKDLFSQGRKRLEEIGRLAAGGGGDYSLLPHQPGVGGIIGEDSYIAGFYSDGRMLFGEANDHFKQTLEHTFSTFKSKLVDVAMNSGGLYVLAQTNVESEQDCADQKDAAPGSMWIDGQCMALYRENGSDGPKEAGQEVVDKVEKKYKMDLYEYMKHVYECMKDGPENREPDLFALPEDSSLPRCFYNLPVRKLIKKSRCHLRCETREIYWDVGDF